MGSQARRPPRAAPSSDADSTDGHFSVFRADSVSVTSTRLEGGDWRWRLCGRNGEVLVEAGGYRSEARCRQAVTFLQSRASRAAAPGRGAEA